MTSEQLPARCRDAVAHCDAELSWGLSAAERERYAAALLPHVRPDDGDEALRAVARNYRLDHRRVIALRDAEDGKHDEAWAEWMRAALGVLRASGLSWSSDLALAEDDLLQVGLIELLRALPSFSYRSRLDTWAHSVIARRLSRFLRDTRAQKRAARPDSLAQLAEDDAPPAAHGDPEAHADAKALAELVRAILRAHPDQRLPGIFERWAHDDQPLAEIGARIGLSHSRARALLQQARELLRDHPDIRAWLDPGDPPREGQA